MPGHDVEAYCLLCECQYEERSTTTIKVTARAASRPTAGLGFIPERSRQLWAWLLGRPVPDSGTHSPPLGASCPATSDLGLP